MSREKRITTLASGRLTKSEVLLIAADKEYKNSLENRKKSCLSHIDTYSERGDADPNARDLVDTAIAELNSIGAEEYKYFRVTILIDRLNPQQKKLLMSNIQAGIGKGNSRSNQYKKRNAIIDNIISEYNKCLDGNTG